MTEAWAEADVLESRSHMFTLAAGVNALSGRTQGLLGHLPNAT